MNIEKAPHTAKNTVKEGEQKEKENDTKREIFNYVFKEK